MTSSSGLPPLTQGCADGVRDSFRLEFIFPNIAGCAGGWSVPGVKGPAVTSCNRNAGDDSANPAGMGCGVEDLCQEGWHVCSSANDVDAHSPLGCFGVFDAPAGSFFVTRQSGPGCHQCATGTNPMCDAASCGEDCANSSLMTNDIFGCGRQTGGMAQTSCSPLNTSSNDNCNSLGAPWSCPGGGFTEANTVVKTGPANGGVLCCRDPEF